MAVDATSVVVSLEAQTGGLEAGVRRADAVFGQSMSKIEQSATSVEGAIVRSSGNSAAAQLILQSAVRRTSDQFAAGAPISTIFAEHINSVAEAASLAGGAFGTFGEIMAGPWGLAISGAIAIGSTLVATLLSGADAAETDAKAHDDLKEALDRMNSAAAAANHTTRQGIIDDLNAADAARQHEIRVRGLLAAQLEQSKQSLASARAQTGIGNVGSAGAITQGDAIGASVAAQQIAAIEGAMKLNDAKLARAQSAVRVQSTKLVLRDVAAATDKVTAATNHYDDALDQLERQYQKPGSKLSKAQFEAQALELTKARDAAVDAARATEKGTSASRSHASARSDEAKAIREAEAAEKLRERTLDTLQDKYDPATAAVRRYHDALREIASMNLDPATAGKYAAAATAEFVKARAKLFELPVVEGYRADEADKEKQAKADAAIQAKAAEEAEREAQRQREDHVRTTANLYYDLFSGGTHRLWQDFERIGLQIISKLLAEWTINSLSPQGGGGGGIGGLLGSLANAFGVNLGQNNAAISSWMGGGSSAGLGFGGSFTSIAGARASGGPVAAGAPYLVGERGPEIIVPNQSGTVLPSGRMPRAAMGASGGTVVHQYFTLDNRGGITTEKLLRQVDAITQERAAQAGSVAYRQAIADTPGKVRQTQVLGS